MSSSAFSFLYLIKHGKFHCGIGEVVMITKTSTKSCYNFNGKADLHFVTNVMETKSIKRSSLLQTFNVHLHKIDKLIGLVTVK